MRKYWILITNEFQRQLTFRVNIASYSLGNIVEIFVQIIIWTVIFQNSSSVRGYTYPEMMTYVILGWFLLFATSNYAFEEHVAKDIHQGTLSNIIIKPISYARYMTAISIGRIFVAFIIVVITEIFLIIFLHSKIIINLNPLVLLLIFLMMLAAFFIKLLISLLIGLLAFWITEISGTYFSLNIISKFLSGAYFPMNLLPSIFVNVSLFFPFIYTFFVPIQLYLGKISLGQGVRGFGVELLWLAILYLIIKFVWRVGLKRYESAGS